MSWVSERDRDCRYVPEHPSVPSFTRLLEKFGILLPSGVTIGDLVRWGWLRPALRVAIPVPNLKGWARFPLIGIERQIRHEDVWIDRLWHYCFIHFPDDPASPWDDEWFVHRLDRSDDFAREVRSHTLAAKSRRPRLVQLRSGQKTQPWIDFFSTWQAFEVFDLLRAARLHAPLLNAPAAARTVRNLVRHLPTLQRFADRNRQLVTRRWETARPVLEWIYQYRTLLGIWLGRHGGGSQRRLGAKALAKRLGINSTQLRAGVRDVLLELWKHLEHIDVPAKVREDFRQDVYWGTDFLQQLTGRRVDPYEEYWDPPDRNPRKWERLRYVLPFELDESKHELPHLASFYLERYNGFVLERRRYGDTRIRDLTERWWPHSYAFRRFCLAFLRLHRHYGGAVNREHRIQITVETPIDFLLLLVLFVEKLQAERFLHTTGPTSLPGFNALLLRRAGAIETAWRLRGLEALVKKEMPTTTLYKLTLKSRKNHFKPARRTSVTRYVADTLLTFARLRNYAAHHDKLDQELIHTKIAATALESLLVVAFLTLETTPLPK